MKKKIYNFNGLKFLISGLVLMAVLSYIFEIIMLKKVNAVFYIGNTIGLLIGFILIILGIVVINKYRKEFKISFVYALAGPIFLVIRLFLIYTDYKNGKISIAFWNMGIMFFDYLAILSMLMVYLHTIKGVSQLFAKYGEINSAKKNIRISYISIGIIWINLLLVSFFNIFEDPIRFVLIVILATISLICKVLMSIILGKAYKLLHGRIISE